MTTPKFKIGDRVKGKDTEWRDWRGEVKELRDDSSGWQYAMTGGGLWWHESNLSLDVPEPKQLATRLEAELGAEIINLNYQVADQKKEIERLTRINTKHLYDAAELSRRLTEEVGGRHRERFTKESSLGEANLLKENRLVLHDKLMAAATDAYIERTAKEAAQKELAQTKENERWYCDKLSELANELSAERVAKTSAKKELAEALRYIAEIHALSRPRKS